VIVKLKNNAQGEDKIPVYRGVRSECGGGNESYNIGR
jgi:hypothetical protein